MPRTGLFDALVRAFQQTDVLDAQGARAPSRRRDIGRRQFLEGTARATAAAAIAAGVPARSWAARTLPIDVGIVGGGLAGLRA